MQRKPSITKDPRATQGVSPGCQTGVPTKLCFALGISYRAKSWTMCSVADAKRSATRNSSVASCYQPSSCLVDDNFHLGSVSSAVKCHGKDRADVVVSATSPTARTPVTAGGPESHKQGFLRPNRKLAKSKAKACKSQNSVAKSRTLFGYARVSNSKPVHPLYVEHASWQFAPDTVW
jgi:hypothetical protein